MGRILSGVFGKKYVVLLLAVGLYVLVSQPLAYVGFHGLDWADWNQAVAVQTTWWNAITSFDIGKLYEALAALPIIKLGIHMPGSVLIAVSIMWIIFAVLLLSRVPTNRIVGGKFGDAEWATDRDLAIMRRGLELGRDPKTGRRIRVALEGNLITYGPPRKGKTSGYILPNLACCDENAWSGPAIVIDPKGEVYRAVKERREALGRRVVFIDLTGQFGGADCLNPLEGLTVDDVLLMQGLARVLLPEITGSDANAGYFTNNAVDLLVGAMIVAITEGKPTLPAVARLCTDIPGLLAKLQGIGEPAAAAAAAVLEFGPRTHDPLVATAKQAFQWLNDKAMARTVARSTFALADICKGNCDLFIAIHADTRRFVVAPFIRALLSNLFRAVRIGPVKERIVVFVDEADTLGYFDEIVTGVAELPGHGLSLWMFWHSMAQIDKCYGTAAAETIRKAMDVTTVFNIAQTSADEKEYWSKVLGSYTAYDYSTTTDGAGKKQTSMTPGEYRLVPESNISKLLSKQQFVFINDPRYTTRPLLIDKTAAHKDARFRRLLHLVAPVKRAE